MNSPARYISRRYVLRLTKLQIFWPLTLNPSKFLSFCLFSKIFMVEREQVSYFSKKNIFLNLKLLQLQILKKAKLLKMTKIWPFFIWVHRMGVWMRHIKFSYQTFPFAPIDSILLVTWIIWGMYAIVSRFMWE